MLKVLLFIVLAMTAIGAESAEGEGKLIKPKEIISERSLSKSALDSMILAPLRYDTFWNSGDERLARSALSANFVDHTLPADRAQGPAGPINASKTFRAAVPDLTCEVEQILVAANRVTTFLRFRGHFTGEFNGRKGQGQRVDFIAIDIYQVTGGAITEDWHLEDNLTLLKQLGVLAR
jgi:predicted ester cyclase